jgi:hypothetical protein
MSSPHLGIAPLFRSDALSEPCNVSREVRETCLGHALGGVESAYRRQDGLKARAIAMHRYEAWLLSGKDQGEEQDNVVAFHRRA